MNQHLQTPQSRGELWSSEWRSGSCRQVQKAHSAGPRSLYQHPAGKLSAAAELPRTDSGTGRDVDDKVHRLKWFSSEAQLRHKGTQCIFPALCRAHTHPSHTPRLVKESQIVLTVVKRVCGPISVIIILVSLCFTV